VESYFGQPEKELVDFICQMINEQKAAEEIQSELDSVFSKTDSEKFVMELWRKLIEIPQEVKRAGQQPAKTNKKRSRRPGAVVVDKEGNLIESLAKDKTENTPSKTPFETTAKKDIFLKKSSSIKSKK